MELGDHLVSAIIRSGVGEIINYVAADPRPFRGDSALCSVICCPLKSKSRVVGAVVVGSESMRHYNAADLQLLNALDSQAAAAVEVARSSEGRRVGNEWGSTVSLRWSPYY